MLPTHPARLKRERLPLDDRKAWKRALRRRKIKRRIAPAAARARSVSADIAGSSS